MSLTAASALPRYFVARVRATPAPAPTHPPGRGPSYHQHGHSVYIQSRPPPPPAHPGGGLRALTARAPGNTGPCRVRPRSVSWPQIGLCINIAGTRHVGHPALFNIIVGRFVVKAGGFIAAHLQRAARKLGEPPPPPPPSRLGGGSLPHKAMLFFLGLHDLG